MIKLTAGFKLFQPWADEVATGAMPYLVRSINTHKKHRVGIMALKKVDRIWQNCASQDWVEKIMKDIGVGIIGSVEIINSIKVEKSKIESELTKLAGKDYFENYYPKYLIPPKDILYIWILDKPKKWKKPIKIIKQGAINWAKIDVNDEYF